MKSFSVKAIATSIVLVLLFATSINAQSYNYSLTYTAAIQSNNHAEMVSNAASVKSGSIKFNPNSIADGVLKIKMYNQPEGVYTVQLVDADGNVVAVKAINHTEDKSLEIADFGRKVTGGTYQIVVVNPENKKTSETIMLLI